jgi:hypothetical protein
MAGLNSDRRGTHRHQTVETVVALDMRTLRRLSFVRAGECIIDTVRWSNACPSTLQARLRVDLSDLDAAMATITVETQSGPIKQRIDIEALPCRHGGHRFYFRLPGPAVPQRCPLPRRWSLGFPPGPRPHLRHAEHGRVRPREAPTSEITGPAVWRWTDATTARNAPLHHSRATVGGDGRGTSPSSRTTQPQTRNRGPEGAKGSIWYPSDAHRPMCKAKRPTVIIPWTNG